MFNIFSNNPEEEVPVTRNPVIKDDTLLMVNDGVNICARACAVCWDTKLPLTYEERSTYIGKRTKIGHTSVIEHSNLVFYLAIDLETENDDLIEFLDAVEYIHTCYKPSAKVNENFTGYLIVGGSWRAFSDLFYVMNAEILENNSIMIRVVKMLKQYAPSAAFRDIIEHGILTEESFSNIRMDEASKSFNKLYNSPISDNLDCISCDDIDALQVGLMTMCPEPYLFSIYDLLDFVTITINFKGMSRIITQQLTRHRNGITQESQRYVNYSKGSFNSPAKFKKYDPNHKYEIKFGSAKVKMTLQELGDAMCSVYGQLTDKSTPANVSHALAYEDARGYLPNNVQCGTIYITFTWRRLFKFLQLREDPHAQAEMRGYGVTIGEWFRMLYREYSDLYKALDPKSINVSQYTIPLNMNRYMEDGTPIEGIENHYELEEVLEIMDSNYENNQDSIPVEPEAVEEEYTLKNGEI